MSSHPDTISAYDSQIKEKKKNWPKSPIYQYISDISATISKLVKQTHMSLGFFCILSIYRQYIGEDPRADIIGHVEG